MKDFFDFLQSTPLPDLLIIVGLLLIVLAIVGAFTKVIRLETKVQKIIAPLVGIIFIGLGCFIVAWTDNSVPPGEPGTNTSVVGNWGWSGYLEVTKLFPHQNGLVFYLGATDCEGRHNLSASSPNYEVTSRVLSEAFFAKQTVTASRFIEPGECKTKEVDRIQVQ